MCRNDYVLQKKKIGNMYLKLTRGDGPKLFSSFLTRQRNFFAYRRASRAWTLIRNHDRETSRVFPVNESLEWWRRNLPWYCEMYHVSRFVRAREALIFSLFHHVNHVKKKNLRPYQCEDVFDYRIREGVEKSLQTNVTRQTVLYIICRRKAS